MASFLRLGVNVDHAATLRNVRSGLHPDPVRAAHLAVLAGADAITVHVHEDRRPISELDVERLKRQLFVPLTLEMAPSPDLVAFAVRIRPHSVCLVPQDGPDDGRLTDAVRKLREEGVRCILSVHPDPVALEMARRIGVAAVELHAGAYCAAFIEGEASQAEEELERLQVAATLAQALGLEVHAGHDLDFDSAGRLAGIGEIVELVVGHFLMAEGMFIGLDEAVKMMSKVMEQGRMRLERTL